MQQLARLMMARRLISLIWVEEMYAEDDDDDDDAHTDMLEPQGFDKKLSKELRSFFSQASRPLLLLALWD